jgi:hypothetical protein
MLPDKLNDILSAKIPTEPDEVIPVAATFIADEPFATIVPTVSEDAAPVSIPDNDTFRDPIVSDDELPETTSDIVSAKVPTEPDEVIPDNEMIIACDADNVPTVSDVVLPVIVIKSTSFKFIS